MSTETDPRIEAVARAWYAIERAGNRQAPVWDDLAGKGSYLHDAAVVLAAADSVDPLRAALARVTALHHQDDDGTLWCAEDGFGWPCPTAAALLPLGTPKEPK